MFFVGWSTVFLFRLNRANTITWRDFDAIIQSGELRVCGENDPFSSYIDSTGHYGFDYERIQAFANLHSLKVVYNHEINLERRIKGLESGQYDVLTGPLPILATYRKRLTYTKPLRTSRLVLVQRSTDNLIRNQVDLAGKQVVLPASSPHLLRINHLAVEIGDSIHIKPVRVTDNEALVNQILSGKVAYGAMDEDVAKALKNKYPELDCSTPLSLLQFHGWAVHQGSTTLLDTLNAFIQTYKN